jgi:glycosyltransferase involved in cell wall biosynthesis
MSVFNGGAILPETLDSIFAQQHVDLELIVVNDGSTDSTSALLRKFSAEHRQVKVLDQENRGLTRALIRACTEAKGEFIARQDVGDLSLPNRFARQLDALCNNRDLVFVSCWTEFVGPMNELLYISKGNGNTTKPTWILSEKESRGVIDGPTCHGSVMYSRDSYGQVGGYRKQFVYGQDWDLWYRLGEIGKFQTVEEILYKARIIPDSISAGNRKKQTRIGRLSRRALSLRLQGENDSACLKKVTKICNERVKNDIREGNARQSYFIAECLRRNKDIRCREYFMKAIKGKPIFWRAWTRLLQTFTTD